MTTERLNDIIGLLCSVRNNTLRKFVFTGVVELVKHSYNMGVKKQDPHWLISCLEKTEIKLQTKTKEKK